MGWPEIIGVWSVRIIGACIMGLIAVWFLWQFTIHVGNLLQVWGYFLVWWGYRKRCTCEASDPVKQGLQNWKMSWRQRLTSRDKGIF